MTEKEIIRLVPKKVKKKMNWNYSIPAWYLLMSKKSRDRFNSMNMLAGKTENEFLKEEESYYRIIGGDPATLPFKEVSLKRAKTPRQRGCK
jgi:hypothetical protein